MIISTNYDDTLVLKDINDNAYTALRACSKCKFYMSDDMLLIEFEHNYGLIDYLIELLTLEREK